MKIKEDLTRLPCMEKNKVGYQWNQIKAANQQIQFVFGESINYFPIGSACTDADPTVSTNNYTEFIKGKEKR